MALFLTKYSFQKGMSNSFKKRTAISNTLKIEMQVPVTLQSFLHFSNSDIFQTKDVFFFFSDENQKIDLTILQ